MFTCEKRARKSRLNSGETRQPWQSHARGAAAVIGDRCDLLASGKLQIGQRSPANVLSRRSTWEAWRGSRPRGEGYGYRWFRSLNVYALEHYRRRQKDDATPKFDGGEAA